MSRPPLTSLLWYESNRRNREWIENTEKTEKHYRSGKSWEGQSSGNTIRSIGLSKDFVIIEDRAVLAVDHDMGSVEQNILLRKCEPESGMDWEVDRNTKGILLNACVWKIHGNPGLLVWIRRDGIILVEFEGTSVGYACIERDIPWIQWVNTQWIGPDWRGI